MKNLLPLFLCTVAFLNIAKAQSIFKEDFSTATNGANLNGFKTWTANSSIGGLGDCGLCSTGRTQIVDAVLTSPVPAYGTPTTKAVQLTPDRDAPGTFFTTPPTSGTVYAACLLKFTTGATVQTQGDFLRLYSTSSFSTVARLMAIQTASGMRFGIQGSSNAPIAFSDALNTYPNANTHLVVIKYEFVAGEDNDIIKLFVNPTVTTAEPTTAAAMTTSNDAAANLDPTIIKGFAFRLNTVAANLPSGLVGQMKVSTTWAGLFSTTPSNVIAIDNSTKISIYPQPVNDLLNVEFTAAKTTVSKITVTDVSGKTIYVENARITEGVNQFSILTQKWAKGLYFVSINDGEAIITQKFIK